MTADPRGVAFGGLLAMAVAMGIGRFVYTPILPHMAEALPLTAGEAGLIASANFLGYLAGALAAALPLPGSRRSWLVGALAASAATTALTAFLTGLPALAAMRLLGGMASAFVLVFASSLVLERLAEARRGGLAALHFAGVGSGIVLSAALVSLLSALGTGWRGLWLAAGLLALAAVPAVARLVPPVPPRRDALAAGPLSLKGGLAALILSYGLFGFGYVVTATFLVAIVRAVEAARPLEPVVWIVVGLAAIPSVGLWNAVGRRLGVGQAYALACLVEAAGVALSVLAPGPAGILAAAVCFGSTFTGITALGFVAVRPLTASDPRRVMALMTASFGAGQMLGPALAGALVDWTGSFVLPSLLAAGALLLAAALGLAAQGRRAA